MTLNMTAEAAGVWC